MSFSYFSLFKNKPSKPLRRVDQSLLVQWSSSKLIWVLLVICKHHWYLMVTILLRTVVVPDFLLAVFFHGFALTPHRDVCVQFLLQPSISCRVFGRRQTLGCKLLSCGVRSSFPPSADQCITEWCCFGSVVILGGAHYLQIFLHWKTICKKTKWRIQNSFLSCSPPLSGIIYPCPSDPHKLLWLFLGEGEKKQYWKVGVTFSKCQHILVPLQGWQS